MSVTVIMIALMSVSVITLRYDDGMARWEPDSQGRLAQAALDLFAEQGFDNTTVAEIAERAGLTERTFFRHFNDKREVLFAGASALQDLLVTGVLGAPEGTTPIEAVVGALEAGASLLQQRHAFALHRYRVIEASIELQERELIKLASLATAVTVALHERGVAEPAASLTAEAGIAIFRVAFARWVQEPEDADFVRLIRQSLDDLRAATLGQSV